MAAGTTLKMSFETMTGKKTWSYGHANPSVTLANVKALGQAMVTNGSVYQNQPLTLTSAKLVTTTESEFDLTQ